MEHSCVECNADHTRANLLAKESEKCFDFSCDGFGNCDWNELSCADDNRGKCDYGCGASEECNGKYPDSFYDTEDSDLSRSLL